MCHPRDREAALRDAAQYLEFAAARLLRADAQVPANDQRVRKLLSHVQNCADVARGLATAVSAESETEVRP